MIPWWHGIMTWSHGIMTWSHGIMTWSDTIMTWGHGIMTWSHGIMTWSHRIMAWSHGVMTWGHGVMTWSHGVMTWSHRVMTWSHGLYTGILPRPSNLTWARWVLIPGKKFPCFLAVRFFTLVRVSTCVLPGFYSCLGLDLLHGIVSPVAHPVRFQCADGVMPWSHGVMTLSHGVMTWSHGVMMWSHGIMTWSHGVITWCHGMQPWYHACSHGTMHAAMVACTPPWYHSCSHGTMPWCPPSTPLMWRLEYFAGGAGAAAPRHASQNKVIWSEWCYLTGKPALVQGLDLVGKRSLLELWAAYNVTNKNEDDEKVTWHEVVLHADSTVEDLFGRVKINTTKKRQCIFGKHAKMAGLPPPFRCFIFSQS